MFKRFLDIIISSIGLIFLIPIILPIIIVIWWEDKKTPFYTPLRVGKNNKMFKMIKLRSMYVDADKSKVNSTSDNDLRITSIGKKIRKYKLDELVQLWNVLLGDMSLVGPRPNIKSETDLYTDVEKDLLSVKPGITDFSSIVFTDEGKILEDKKDPDLAYNQLIRPWKSRLSLIYIKNQSNLLDLQIIILTLIAFISKRKALQLINKKLINLGADIHTIKTSLRENQLSPHTPPD